MSVEIETDALKVLEDFALPEYNEIPDVGLYLKQTVKYLSEYLEPVQGITITESMVSNYVKQKLVESPVRKEYHRDQIAILFFIAFAKSVLSLEEIRFLIGVMGKSEEPVPERHHHRCEQDLHRRVLCGVCGENREDRDGRKLRTNQEKTNGKSLFYQTRTDDLEC